MVVNLVMIHVVGGDADDPLLGRRRAAPDRRMRPRASPSRAVRAVAVRRAVVIVARGDAATTLRATFPSAVNVVKGAEVRAGGVRVGKVDAIELHGRRRPS